MCAPNTDPELGLNAQKQTEIEGEDWAESKEKRRGRATWSLHRWAALNIKLWLTFRFYGKTFTIEKIFSHSQSRINQHSLPLPLSPSLSLCARQKFIMLLKDTSTRAYAKHWPGP